MDKNKEILFVSHDANRAGAQIFLYNIMKHLQDNGYKIVLLIVNNWGSFKPELETTFLHYYYQEEKKGLLRNQKNTLDIIKQKHNIGLAYVNTIAAAHLLESIKETFSCPVATHIHELSYSIQQYAEPGILDKLYKYSDRVIACSSAVAKNLDMPDKTVIVHSFIDNDVILSISKTSNKDEVSSKFGLDPSFTWIAACGNADWRKAPDIFVQIAAKSENSKLRFAWIGIKENDPLKYQLTYDAAKLGVTEKIRWIEPTPEAVPLINSMDYFLLCSREDPFPLVMLEAAVCAKPIFTFSDTGGGDEFVEDDAGIRVSYLNVLKMAYELDNMDLNTAKELGANARKKVLTNYNFTQSIEKIEKLLKTMYTLQ